MKKVIRTPNQRRKRNSNLKQKMQQISQGRK